MDEFEMENEYVENIPTEEFNPADDYTIDSYAQQAPEQKKEYPVLQTITSLATGVESKGPVDSKQLINESYNAYAPKVQDEQKSLALEAAKTGNTQQLDFLVQDMHQRNRELLAQKQNEVKRISELAGKAYENLVFKSYGVVVNNTPEQIANYIDKSSNSATVAAINEQWIKNDLTLGEYAKSVALSFTLFGVTPTYALGSVAEKYIDKDSSKVFYGDNVRGLKNYYDSLPNEDARVSFVTSIKKELEDTWSLTKSDAAGIVQRIIGTEEITTFENVAETASPVIGALPLVGQLARAGKAVSAANKIAKAATNAEKILATSGNKSLLVSDAVNQIRLKAATDVISEASGFTTVADLSRLAGRATSWTGTKLLPDAVITASGNVQKEILSSVDKAVQQLKTTLRPANVRAAEVTELEDIVRKSYDRSIDPTIQNVVFGRLDDDLTGVVATILRGTKEGDVFLTKAAVDEYIRVADPNGKKGLKAVQDTANNTHALSEQTKKTLQLERDVAQVKLLELQAQQRKVSQKVAPEVTPEVVKTISAAKLPKELSGARPNYAIGTNKFSLQFDNDIDKAAFITSQTKKSKRDADYVTWLKESTGWDNAKIAEHGQKVRDAIKASAKASEPGKLKVQNQVEQVQTKREVGTKEFWSASRFPEKREAGTRNFWETARPIDNTEEIKKLEATIELIEGRLKAAKDIENGLSAGWLVEEKVTKTLDISKLGKFEESDIQSMIRVSLGDRALGASEEVYKNHLIGVMAESRLRKTLVDMIDEPFQKLSRKEKALLNSVLIKGDKEGTIFDSVQLRGEGLTSDNAQKAYYATRAARDLMWSIRNKAAADSATMKGLKDIWHPSLNKYKDEWNEFKLFGKEVDGVGKTALDPETGKVVNLTKEKVEELTNRGFKVIEFDTPVPMAGVKRNRIVVQSGGLEMNKITQVIPYRNGEYSRMYSDEYFIRLTGRGKGVDDLEEDLVITHRTASNVNEANAYVKAYNEMVDLYKAGKLTTEAASKMQAYGWKAEDLIAQISESPNLRAVKNYTRTEDDYLDALTSYSRNFTSKRGEHIPNVFGETTNVVDPLDALAAEISNTAYVASHSEWLDVSIQRWFETAKPFLPSALKVDSATLETMSADQAFARYMRTKEGYVGGDRTELFIRRVAHQIAEAMKVNDKSSRQMLGVMRTITERIEETTGTMHTVGSFMRQAEWESWAKTFSFHAVFGFNPIQTVVQGLNTVNAIMISPVHGLKAARTAIFLRGAMTSDNPDVWKNIGKVNEWTKLGLGSDDDFIKLVTSLERTGLMQNLQTSSLYGLQAGKNDLTTGFFGKQLSRISKGSSFFFREGEGGARIVSFDIARREWMVKNPGKDWGTDEALREIIERQDVLTGTMTNANAASWQKGLISIPLQFMQFPIKFTLNIANSLAGGKRGFTRKEALTLLGGNVLLFGSAGLYGNSLVQAIFGKEIEEMPETVRIGLAEGAIAAAVSAVSAEFDESERLNLAIGTRLSPLNFYRDLATALTSWEDPGMFETFSGAFGGVVVRSSEALKQIWNLYTIDPDMSPERLSLAVKALATIPSVGRNYFSGQAAENLYNQVVKNGVSQYAVTDKEAFFLKYFGIRNIEATEYWKRTSNKADYQKKMKELAQQITNLRVKSLELYNAGSYADAQIHSDMASILQNSLPLGDRAEVEKMIKEPSPISNRLQDLTRESLFNFGSSQKEYIPIEKK